MGVPDALPTVSLRFASPRPVPRPFAPRLAPCPFPHRVARFMQPSYVTGRTVLSLFGFKPEWAYSIDTYSLLAMMVRAMHTLAPRHPALGNARTETAHGCAVVVRGPGTLGRVVPHRPAVPRLPRPRKALTVLVLCSSTLPLYISHMTTLC